MRQNDLQIKDNLQQQQNENSLIQQFYLKEAQRQKIFAVLMEYCRNGSK